MLTGRYAATGPRGLVVVPAAEAHRLAGLDLPDRENYDRLHEVQAALHRHDRPAAAAAYERMKVADTGHRLTRLARLAIARYDANPTLLLHAIDALLALFPDDNTFQLARLNVLRDLGRKEERTEAARRQAARADADPLFAHHYAQALIADPARLDEAGRLMRRAVRQRPYAPAGYYILGNVLWEQRRFQEATDLYRFAAALEDRDEQFAEAYFRAARAAEQTPEAMRFLKARYERTRGQVAGPARAMFYALSEEDDIGAAFAALEACWSTSLSGGPGRNPQEVGEVMLFAAEMRTNYNDPAAGLQLLAGRPPAGRPRGLAAVGRPAGAGPGRPGRGPPLLGGTARRGPAGRGRPPQPVPGRRRSGRPHRRRRLGPGPVRAVPVPLPAPPTADRLAPRRGRSPTGSRRRPSRSSAT